MCEPLVSPGLRDKQRKVDDCGSVHFPKFSFTPEIPPEPLCEPAAAAASATRATPIMTMPIMAPVDKPPAFFACSVVLSGSSECARLDSSLIASLEPIAAANCKLSRILKDGLLLSSLLPLCSGNDDSAPIVAGAVTVEDSVLVSAPQPGDAIRFKNATTTTHVQLVLSMLLPPYMYCS